MNTPLPPQEPEKLPGEAALAALYRKLPQAEPGPALDQAVLRAAAQALDEESRHATAATPVRRRPRWPIAWGSAAALVLAAGLAWHMREMPEAVAPTMQDTRAAADHTATENVAAPPVAAPGKPLPAPSLRAVPSKPMATPAASPEPVGRATTPVTAAPRREPARKSVTRSATRPQVRQQAAAPPRPAPPVKEAVEPAPAPALPAPPPAPPAPPAPAAMVTSFAAEDPATELQSIRRLFTEGHDKEGRERLLRFHEAHPDWSLPDDLRTRLPRP
jgi:Meckel syndrome type 1 protein